MERNDVAPANSKIALLTQFLRRPDAHKIIGAAWALYFRLLLMERGEIITTYTDLEVEMGVSGRTIKSWAQLLTREAVIERLQRGRQIQLRLLGEHMLIAKALDCIEVVKEAESKPKDRRARSLEKALEAAMEVGSKLEVKMVI